jgi:hypothetical protein
LNHGAGRGRVPEACDGKRNNARPAPDGDTTMAHTCHAFGCETPVAPKLLMCRRHWFMVPKAAQKAVWDTYRPGQERTKDPSPEYLLAAFRAKLEVAVTDGRFSRADADERMAKRQRQVESAYGAADAEIGGEG